MLVVTGATGHLGRLIVQALVQRIAPNQVVATCRDPDKANDLKALGVQVRRADFADPASLAPAFAGAHRVLIVSSNARAQGGDPLAQHRAAIEACRATGVRRVLYTSQMAASDHSAFGPMADHHATEALLDASGLRWTALRNGFYAASALTFLGEAFRTGRFDAPADGPVRWTTHADLAEAAARLLCTEDLADGPTAPLVASESHDFAALTALIAEATGRPCERGIVTDEALRARMAARGLPEIVATISLGFYRASRAGEFDADDDTLARLLGRAPQTMRQVIEDHIAG